MELNINVYTNESCKITITDLTTDYQEESNSNSNVDRFRYSDTISIDVLQLNSSEGRKLYNPVFSKHDYNLESITIPVNFDGWFKICHIIIPTKQWFENEKRKGSTSILGFYQGVYYSDGKEIYKYYNGISEKVDLSEIVERNIRGTTISRYTQDHFSICFLRKCYINLCQSIFNSSAFDKCSNKNKLDCNLTFKRDMVWMAINVINYLVQFNQLGEAQRLVERISSCNGLCSNNSYKSKTNGCGCS